MADKRGGYRPTAPQNNPANVNALGGNGQSGRATQPARYISGLPYGEGQATMEQQTSAPMARVAEPTAMEMPVPLTAPSARPDEPITAGIDFGPGPGSEALMTPNRTPSLMETIRSLIQYDPTGDTELIYRRLVDEGY